MSSNIVNLEEMVNELQRISVARNYDSLSVEFCIRGGTPCFQLKAEKDDRVCEEIYPVSSLQTGDHGSFLFGLFLNNNDRTFR